MAEILRARRKAIIALVVSLVGGLLAVFPESTGLQILAAVLTAAATTFGVHQIPNALPDPAPDDPLGAIVDDLLGKPADADD